MRRFGTEGRLYLEDHYVVPRTEETADFIDRVKQGKYIDIANPIYLYAILQAFKPTVNGLEAEYFSDHQ